MEHLAIDPAAIRADDEGDNGRDIFGCSKTNGFVLASRSMSSSDLPLRNMAVAVGPGATALTVIDRPHERAPVSQSGPVLQRPIL